MLFAEAVCAEPFKTPFVLNPFDSPFVLSLSKEERLFFG
jgi:hypothetical protein